MLDCKRFRWLCVANILSRQHMDDINSFMYIYGDYLCFDQYFYSVKQNRTQNNFIYD